MHPLVRAPRRGSFVGLLLFAQALLAIHGARAQEWELRCADPARGDPVVAYGPLYGQPNASDSAWHDDTRAFMAHGPITAMELYHSGSGWHDPYIGFHPGGEFKGVRPTYGNVTNDDDLLFGARRPHQPFAFSLRPGEKVVRVDLQHDSVMRWMAFTTQLGRTFEWGFRGEPNTTAAAEAAPREGAYLAALRGFEGKQLPKELGGYKKRYIIQIGFAWAMPACSYQWDAPPPEEGQAPPAEADLSALAPEEQAAAVGSLFDGMVSWGDGDEPPPEARGDEAPAQSRAPRRLKA